MPLSGDADGRHQDLQAGARDRKAQGPGQEAPRGGVQVRVVPERQVAGRDKKDAHDERPYRTTGTRPQEPRVRGGKIPA